MILSRGVIAVDNERSSNVVDMLPSSPNFAANNDSKFGPVQFRHDPRLTHPSHMYFTPEQVNNFIDNILCPVLVITGEDGWPISSADEIESRAKILSDKNLFTHYRLPGSHHLHLDPKTAPLVSEKIMEFLKK